MAFKYSFSRRKEILLHIVFWGVVFILSIFYIPTNQDQTFILVDTDIFSWTWDLSFLATFYFHYLIVLPRVLKKFSWWKMGIGFVISTLVFGVFRAFLEQFLTDLIFDKINYPEETTIIFFFFDNFLWSIPIVLLSTAFGTIVHFIRLSEYNNYILKESKNAEIKFLKAQINPHFVFNTLNNIYSMVYFKSKKALPAIEKMSEIMKFTTYEASKKKIKLSEEVEYMESLIGLEELRHEADDFVDFQRNIYNENIEIPPYILSPLVENAIKHGIISNDNPIKINLKTTAQQLCFQVKNSIGEKKKDSLSGIGLENLQKRLAISFPKNHSLTTTARNGEFIATIEITLP